MKYFISTIILVLISISLHAAKLDGKWKSSTANIIYLYEDPNGFRVQVVLQSGETYTWQAQWLEKQKTFWYQTKIGRYTGSIENPNTIIVSGTTEMVDEKGKKNKIKEVYIWRRVYKIQPPKARVKKKKSRVSQRREYGNYRYYYPYPQYLPPPQPRPHFRPEPDYDYDYTIVDWESKKGSKISYQKCISKNKSSTVYGGVDRYGPWIALIIPVLSLEHGNWGISVFFVRSNGKWVLRYMRPMRIVTNRKGIIDWEDILNYSIPINPDDSWSLKNGAANMFYFEYQGNIALGPDRWVRKITVKGKLKSLTE